MEASLCHLQIDCIDLYWLHRDDPTRPVGGVIEALELQVQAGKIRYYGASNWRRERLIAAQGFARANGMHGFAAVSDCWSLAKINLDGLYDPTLAVMNDELWAYHRDEQLAAIPYTSQANGVFQKLAAGQTDRIRPHGREDVSERRSQTGGSRAYWRCATETGMTITQIVLGYLLSQPFPVIPIFSSRNLDQMSDTLSGADVQLTQEQLDFLVG